MTDVKFYLESRPVGDDVTETTITQIVKIGQGEHATNVSMHTSNVSIISDNEHMEKNAISLMKITGLLNDYYRTIDRMEKEIDELTVKLHRLQKENNMAELQDLKDELLDTLITIRELEPLEDYDGASYADVLTEYKWNHQQLKHRLLNLQEMK